MCGVHHNVHADVAQLNRLCHPPRHLQDCVPVGHANAKQGGSSVGMPVNNAIALHGMCALPAVDVHADADASLVKVGAAVRGPGGQAEHRHGGTATVDDEADIGNAFVGQRGKRRV